MRIGIIGSGNVGRTIADAALRSGHEVRLGAREPKRQELRDWLADAGGRASLSEIASAAEFGALLVNATPGDASIEALRAAGAGNLAGKTLIDIANAGSSGPGGFVLSHPSAPITGNIADLARRLTGVAPMPVEARPRGIGKLRGVLGFGA